MAISLVLVKIHAVLIVPDLAPKGFDSLYRIRIIRAHENRGTAKTG